MDAKTRDALEKSITAWEEKVRLAKKGEAAFAKMGATECALCKLYYYNDCIGCPVAAETGQPSCDGSPYMEAYRAYRNAYEYGRPDGAAEAFQKELDFLISLRPPEMDDCTSDYALDSTINSFGGPRFLRRSNQGGDWSRERYFRWWIIDHRERFA